MNELEEEKLNELIKFISENNISNEFLIYNLKLSCDYLNLKSVKQYSDMIKKTTQGIRKYQKNKIIKICGKQFVVNND